MVLFLRAVEDAKGDSSSMTGLDVTALLSADAGLWGVFLSSFLAATLLPGGSELVLLGFAHLHPAESLTALVLATLGNTAGGMTSWALGYRLPQHRVLPHQAILQHWGSPALLLAWVPLIGDALCVAAGWLRLHWLPCCVFMALGKLGRYALLLSLQHAL